MTQLKIHILKSWDKLDASWRFALTVFVAARLLYFLWSWAVFTIQPLAIQNIELSGEPIVTVFRLQNSEAHVYLRELNHQILTFQAAGMDHLIDRQTGTLWRVSDGLAVQGIHEGSVLSPAKTTASAIFPYYDVARFPITLFALWQRFDANLYVTIAENGYGRVPGDTHFPPLFPLLTRVFQPVFGDGFPAGLFVAHLASFYLLKLLYDAFVQWGEEERAKRAVLLFAMYPAFFFLFSAYSEPIFLVTVLLSLRNMQTRSWGWAGFWTFCAILTRLQGAALLIPMVFLMMRDVPFLRKLGHWSGLILPGIGGLFYLYLRSMQTTGNALPLIESEWHARLAPPGETYLYAIRTILAGRATFIDALNFGIATLLLILLVVGWKKIPLEYNLYTVFNLLIIISRVVETQPLNSMSRFSLTLFPVFYILSIAGENPWARRLIVYTSILLNLYLSGQFMIWGWVA